MNNNILDEKLNHWKHRLLDLTKRNKMIHYKPSTRSGLEIITPTLQDLYSKLVDNEETLTFQRPLDRDTDIRVFSFLSLLDQLSAPLAVSMGDINGDTSFSETKKTLDNLRSKSRASIEEKGSNILYLSFGFLEWRTLNDDWVKSPLILVPVTLLLSSKNAPYQLKKHVDEVLINPTLNYYCNTKYGISLPLFTENEDSPTEYLKTLEEIANQRGWKIHTEVSLGLLSFQKISMYNDLIRNEERIKNSPIIRAMAEGIDETEEVFQLPEHIVDFDLDTMSPLESFQVMSADSSQQDAILYSKNNISFVMQGPPGTGKSQTIANIIAEALAADKKILFVAEKATALQVVLQRLSDVHLSDFCLTLHSNETKKRSILEQLDANLKLKQPKVKELALTQLDELSFFRDDLNSYVKELHQTILPLGISCYEASGRLTDLLPYPALSFLIENVGDITQTVLHSYTKVLKEYSNAVERLAGNLKNNPWEGISTRIAGYEFSETMKRNLTPVILSLDSNILSFSQIIEFPSLEKEITIENVGDFFRFLDSFFQFPLFPSSRITQSPEIENILSLTIQTRDDYQLQERLQESLYHVFKNQVKDFDASGWSKEIYTLEKSLCEQIRLESRSTGEIVKNILSIQSTLDEVNLSLDRIETIFSDINRLLGTSFLPSLQSLKVLEDLLLLINENQPLPKELFQGIFQDLEELIHSGEVNAREFFKVRSTILENWEESLLDLDIAEIFQRFKTDYDIDFIETSQKYSTDYAKLKTVFQVDSSHFSVKSIIKVLNNVTEWMKSKKIYEENQKEFQKSVKLVEYYDEKENSSKVLKNEILEDWDKAVFLEEHEELLERFVTEYEKIQRILNVKNYR